MARGLVYRNNNSFPLTATEVDDNFEYLATRETGIDVHAFGAVGDGVTDDGPAIQAAIDFAEAKGGGTVILGGGGYLSEQSLTLDNDHVWLEGVGHVFFQAVPSSASLRATAGTRIIAGNGVIDESFIIFTSPVTGRRKVGGGLRNIVIDGQARAAVGVHVISRAFGQLDRVGVIYCKEDNILFDVHTDPQFNTVGGETACGTIYWRGTQVYCTNVNSAACDNANALRAVGFENLLGVTADADATTLGNPNISQMTFHDSEFLSNDARGVFLTSSNDWLFFNCKANSSLDEPWFMGCSEDDPRLAGHGAKKITLYGCNGNVLARASQTGRNSAKQIRLYAHEGLFDIPVTREAAAGGSPEPDVHVHTSEVGAVEKMEFVGTFTGERRKSTGGIYAETVDVTTTNGQASVTTSGLANTGRSMLGVTTRVVGAGAGTPPDTYSVGIATDTDKYGTGLTWAANTTSGSANYTDASFVASQEIVLTANTLFGGGTVRVTAYYFEATEIYEA